MHRLGADAAVIQTVSVQLASPGLDATGAAGVWMTPVSRIEDRVWNDADGNGVLTDGERGMAQVIVTLVRVEAGITAGVSDGVAVPVAVTTTDSIGRFAVQAVPPGSYVLALGAVVEGTPIASLLAVEPDSPSTAATPTSTSTSTSTEAAAVGTAAAAAAALRTGGSAIVVTVDGSPSISPDLALAVTPANRARIVPGRALIEQPSLLDPADLVPTTGSEWAQAGVFVASMLVFSTVVATTRRRRLLR